MRILVTIIVAMLAMPLHAQTYLAEAVLSPVETSGFYRIPITPDITPYLTDDFANLRIVQGEKAVPYFPETSNGYATSEFTDHEIVEKSQQPGCCTSLVLKNPTGKVLDNIHLKIRNADVSKLALMMGSDDLVKWYGLRDWFYISAINNTEGPSEIRIIDFPRVNYRYIKLQINDSTSAPLNIEAVGYYRSFSKTGQYIPVPDNKVSVETLPREKQTHVRISFDTLQWIDRLELVTSGFPLYRRHAALYQISYYKGKKGKLIEDRRLLQNKVLTHEYPAVLDLPSIRAKELLLVVDNNDNTPLNVDAVKLFQLQRHVIAYLEPGKQYQLKLSEARTRKPVYDLESLKAEIPATLETVEAGKLVWYARESAASSTFFDSRLMWVGIVGIIVLLGLFSVKMIREMKGT